MTDPPEDVVVTAALAELRVLTTCSCRSEYALKNGHESECVELWREDVDIVAAALTYRAVRIGELERDLADAQAILRAMNRKYLAGGR